MLMVELLREKSVLGVLRRFRGRGLTRAEGRIRGKLTECPWLRSTPMEIWQLVLCKREIGTEVFEGKTSKHRAFNDSKSSKRAALEEVGDGGDGKENG